MAIFGIATASEKFGSAKVEMSVTRLSVLTVVLTVTVGSVSVTVSKFPKFELFA